MKTTKKMLRFFTIPEWEKEQDFLQAQHRAGWMLTGVRLPGVYRFRRCDPEEVVYQLDYNPQGQADRAAYVQMFRDCGWDYIQDFCGYSYFRKPAARMDGPEEIFCDDASRADMIRRVFRGRMIPLLVLFLCVILPMFFVSLVWSWYAFSVLYGGLFILYVSIFMNFALKLRACQNARA